MKAGKFIDGVPYSWEEIYELTGYCREDFLYDTSGECYNLLIEQSKLRKEGKMLKFLKNLFTNPYDKIADQILVEIKRNEAEKIEPNISEPVLC